jgi:CRISPR-associated protein Csy3
MSKKTSPEKPHDSIDDVMDVIQTKDPINDVLGVIQTKDHLASMLAFTRSITPSRGPMYACSNMEGDNEEPLRVQTMGVKGTKAFDILAKVEKESKNSESTSKNTKLEDANKPNPQLLDCVYMPDDKPFLKTCFTAKYLCKTKKPAMCNSMPLFKAFSDLFIGFKRASGFSVLSKLYVEPLVTGLWMWRNNDEAMQKRIVITVSHTLQKFIFTPGYNHLSVSQLSEDQQLMAAELASMIDASLSGEDDLLVLEVESVYMLGRGVPAYPSQEMNTAEKKEGDVSRTLYRIGANGVSDQAGFHDVKIGNALRTIDIWHGNEMFEAIAVEPLGVVGTFMVSTRVGQKRDFFSLVKANLAHWAAELKAGKTLEDIENRDDLLFVMAVLIRGGSFV